ncbi:hypothetical protein AALB64_15285 [Lachnospiraceae bacterium 45-P1]
MKSGIRRVRRARARHKREQRFLYGYYMLLLIVSVIVAGMIVGCGMAAAHVYLNKGDAMMKVAIVMENGEKEILYLTEEQVNRLQHEVDKQNEYYRELGEPENYTLNKELRYAIYAYLDDIPKPMEAGS